MMVSVWLNSPSIPKRCSEWDYIKRKAPRVAGIALVPALARPNSTDCSTRLGWTKGWYKGALRDKVYGEIAGETKPGMEDDQNQTSRARPQIRPRRLNRNHIERFERKRGVLPLGRDNSPAVAFFTPHATQVPKIQNGRNTRERCATRRLRKGCGNTFENILESA